ncbi:MotA/TolQ/ExbB proton channel family protein [Rubrimonas cliftonensis]|uniref:Outer membrane transport energization protein ExbB n=1 Tax=Rubrimonas cliftonensis TaxID=89524 RepID=A0A1H4DM99_9RHOB|nr:MotA/TolQ/ExbB proton channel family protein [Rubrimonas cliftonensis]SEA73885.1 outer membrane transport energization protein ExbB [Rubrimonas cliftonensis]
MERLAEAMGSTGALLARGGPVAWLLAALSIVAATVALAKLWQFAVVRPADPAPRRAALLWRSGRRAEAEAALAGARSPAAEGLACAVAAMRAGVAPETARAEAARVAEAALDDLRDWLRPLEVIAALAPLLGLFGTVLGMIDAFAAMEAAGAQVDPATLSGGVWTALLTTAIGLGVAMPTVAALSWCERQVERAERAVDDALAAAFGPALPAVEAAAAPGAAQSLRPRLG